MGFRIGTGRPPVGISPENFSFAPEDVKLSPTASHHPWAASKARTCAQQTAPLAFVAGREGGYRKGRRNLVVPDHPRNLLDQVDLAREIGAIRGRLDGQGAARSGAHARPQCLERAGDPRPIDVDAEEIVNSLHAQLQGRGRERPRVDVDHPRGDAGPGHPHEQRRGSIQRTDDALDVDTALEAIR